MGAIDLGAFLLSCGIEPLLFATAQNSAVAQNKPLRDVLFAQGLISQQDYIRGLASHLGLICLFQPEQCAGLEVETVEAATQTGFVEPHPQGGMLNLIANGESYVALDVLHYDENTLQQFFSGQMFAGSRLLLITPELKNHLLAKHQNDRRLDTAIYGLAREFQGYCAREKTSFGQRFVLAILLGLLAGGLIFSTIPTLYFLGGVLNLLFLYTILLRLYAVLTLKRPSQDVAVKTDQKSELPLYTILVPLFRESRVVKTLIEHLLALDYPRDRLEIKLIFEADDEATIAGAQACAPPACFQFVMVPKSLPQTKPKALNYGLSEACGDYVVVYDAEDRPEPDQLKKALFAFIQGEQGLACVQASLNHYNVDENWLARQFTIEYTALFDGLLPALQRLGLPIPLGGTSNHFRTELLRKIGGWDAFNVTEDADLGIRLVRFGYHSEMLASTTYEEACCRPRDWVCQRTRWLKGWLQTYLVHMRHPVDLFKQLGARGFAGFQIILGAQVLSLIAHPVFIVFMAYEASSGHLFERPYGAFGYLFWSLALGNLVFGYVVAIWLGFATLRRRKLGRLSGQLLFMPFYWLLISIATFRALIHYVIKPFHWEKTEHGLGQKGK